MNNIRSIICQPKAAFIMVIIYCLTPWGCQSEQETIAEDSIKLEAQTEILEAVHHLLSALGPEAREIAVMPFDSSERFNFNFIPMERKGLRLKDMNEFQRIAAHNLLQTALSTQGYLKATAIMHLDDILYFLEGEDRVFDRDPELYYFTFFGEPSVENPWGWRFEGHHISLSFTSVTNELFATTPAFMGSNPAEVRNGSYTGLRVLAKEEYLGRALVKSLSEQQLTNAMIMVEVPGDIITGSNRKVEIGLRVGLSATEMNQEQREMLWRIVEEYAHNLRRDMAEIQLERIIEAGIDQLSFGWAGGLNRGEPHYYRIHGPTVLFEYDNVQNNANHIHTVWRDLENDFGDDILRRHYDSAPKTHGHDH
jgi:hypothetical protein